MEGQGNILKTLFITAAVYTLALGAPVKRATSGNTVNETCAAAARVRSNLPTCTSTTATKWSKPSWAINNGEYNERSVAGDLPAKLETHSFNGAVSEAVRKCYNNSDCDPQKCKLAAAAIILQDSTTNFIAAYGGSATAQTSCTTPTSSFTDEEVQQILCNASVYIMKLLQDVDKGRGPYYNSCKA